MKEEYWVIRSGRYGIGIDEEVIGTMQPDQLPEGIKLEYFYNANPRHEITLKTVQVCRSLVTAAAFQAFVEATGFETLAEKEHWGWVWEKGWTKREGVSWRNPFGDEADVLYRENTGQLPVLQLCWNDAEAYCDWLTQTRDDLYRLPTEGEWEVFAEMAGVPSLRAADWTEERKEYSRSTDMVEQMMRTLETCGSGHPVGLLWEWCEDWFDSYPSGRENKEYGTVYKVLRGGSLQSHPLQRTREYRFRRCPTARSPFYGFRVVRV